MAELLAVLLEGWWRWQRCCCFSVQTGTTILGILKLIVECINFIAVCAVSTYDYEAEDSDTERRFRQILPLALTTGTKAVLGIIAVIGIITASLLIHGNFKNISKFMKPAVYWWLICLILSTILSIIGICQVASIDAAYVAPLIIILLLNWVIGLFVIQVIRCRIADVEEVEIH